MFDKCYLILNCQPSSDLKASVYEFKQASVVAFTVKYFIFIYTQVEVDTDVIFIHFVVLCDLEILSINEPNLFSSAMKKFSRCFVHVSP